MLKKQVPDGLRWNINKAMAHIHTYHIHDPVLMALNVFLEQVVDYYPAIGTANMRGNSNIEAAFRTFMVEARKAKTSVEIGNLSDMWMEVHKYLALPAIDDTLLSPAVAAYGGGNLHCLIGALQCEVDALTAQLNYAAGGKWWECKDDAELQIRAEAQSSGRILAILACMQSRFTSGRNRRLFDDNHHTTVAGILNITEDALSELFERISQSEVSNRPENTEDDNTLGDRITRAQELFRAIVNNQNLQTVAGCYVAKIVENLNQFNNVYDELTADDEDGEDEDGPHH